MKFRTGGETDDPDSLAGVASDFRVCGTRGGRPRLGGEGVELVQSMLLVLSERFMANPSPRGVLLECASLFDMPSLLV